MASVTCKLDCGLLPEKRVGNLAASLQSGPIVVSPITAGREDETLSLLSAPSLTNVIMAGLIRDNGIVDSHNRGRFYICHDERGKVEGVALIGHSVLFEAFTDRAIEAFAKVARRESSTHLLMGQRNIVRRFWNYYADPGQSPRHLLPILFLQRREPFDEQSQISGLRPATGKDLEHVVRAQAAMAFETSGVDPLLRDPVGFRQRYLRRIDMNRVWVLMKNGRLVFKTDVIAETPEATYIEGVYVSPEERGKGIGQTCLAALGRIFLERTKAIYLFVENEDTRTQAFYSKLGFSEAGQYDLLYF